MVHHISSLALDEALAGRHARHVEMQSGTDKLSVQARPQMMLLKWRSRTHKADACCLRVDADDPSASLPGHPSGWPSPLRLPQRGGGRIQATTRPNHGHIAGAETVLSGF
ncbi:hypothetical protein NW757_005626 [Fusarium falciforme]|nr:hypothetical protein NW757_005626 [Fusarium falciforme]